MASTIRAPVASRISFRKSQLNGERVVNKGTSKVMPTKSVATCSLDTNKSRREALGMVAIGAASLFMADQANANESIKIKNFSKQLKANGYQDIYEARELDNTQVRTKDGEEAGRFALKQLSLSETKERLNKSATVIATEIPPLISKEYYPVAQRELRRQVGYLRFDCNTIIASQGRAERKVTKGAKEDLLNAIEVLDFNLNEKQQGESAAALTNVNVAFDAFKAKMG